MRNKINPLLLSLLSALLLAASWVFHFALFSFFAFVPLLFIEAHFSTGIKQSKHALKFFGVVYLTFFVWNILVTWWVTYASFGGACLAFFANSLLMTMVFLFFSSIKNKINSKYANYLLIPIWMAWEHGHSIWDLTWTWLTLGNAFSFNHNWVQWYEFTGVSGGTGWILLCNVMVFETIKNNASLSFFSKPILKIAAIILFPILISYALNIYRVKNAKRLSQTNVCIVQPNVDPYNDKFTLDYRSQFLKVLGMLRNKNLSKTEYLMLPETFITENLNEENINEAEEIQWFRDSLIKKYPQLKIICGANTYLLFKQEDKNIPATARKDDRGFYYDVYNTALQIDLSEVQIYHKSKLVPGVERMPFPALLKPLESLAIDMGGTMGSLGTQEERSVFKNGNNNFSVSTIVCYESIFADYNTQFIRNGADAIFVITNDGWWDNTPGYIHHLNYSKLRAIENRREIARCANTGISCFIDAFGNTTNETEWWKEAVIFKQINLNSELTFFSKHGDLLSYLASGLGVLLVLLWLFYFFKPQLDSRSL
jgi:apolipoprotein N-acyltransferase